MGRAKKFLIILLLFVCCLSLSGCDIIYALILSGGDDSVPKEGIIQYVTENVTALESFPYESYMSITTGKETSDRAKKAFIRKELGQNTIVKNVYIYNSGIVDFFCGGTGNVVSSTYCGFYYSESDEPFAFEFEKEANLSKTSEGVYEWDNNKGKAIYTERILPKWFYYYLVWL